MEYSPTKTSRRSPPRGTLSRSQTDDENHSVFDYSLEDGFGKRKKKNKTGKKMGAGVNNDVNDDDDDESSPNASSKLRHPYPTTIAIQTNDGKDDNSNSDDDDDDDGDDDDDCDGMSPTNDRRRRGGNGGSEVRSPFTSPGQRGGGGESGGGGGGGRRGKGGRGRSRGRRRGGGRSKSESRQPNSPLATSDGDAGVIFGGGGAGCAYSSSELSKYHADGMRHFNMNRLSEAVESYSRALRVGLEELAHRREMVTRMTNGGMGEDMGIHCGDANFVPSERDGVIMALSSSISRVHADLGKALEIAQRYGDARKEYTAGMDILRRGCHVTEKDDGRVRELKSNSNRMKRAMDVERDRRKHAAILASAYQRLERVSDDESNNVDRDSARRNLISCLDRCMRIERDSVGERSYGYAKLKLKSSKAKFEYGDVEGGTVDADAAARTIKSVLGSSHAIVGAASSFVAGAYERRGNVMYEAIMSRIPGGGGFDDDGGGYGGDGEQRAQLTPECKSMFTKALEWYADALGPMRYKYDGDNREDDRDDNWDANSDRRIVLRPDVGDVFRKISILYTRRGNSRGSAIDACHRALEAYGAGGIIDPTNAIKSKVNVRDMCSMVLSSYGNFHPDAAFVWRDLARLHLTGREYGDAVYAAERALEFSRMVLKGAHCDTKGIDALPSSALHIAGDGYVGLRRYEDATRSYREAYSEYRRVGRAICDGYVDGATILDKLGMTFYHRGMLDEAKAHLMDALRAERSSKDRDCATGSASRLPLILSDIGMVHSKCILCLIQFHRAPSVHCLNESHFLLLYKSNVKNMPRPLRRCDLASSYMPIADSRIILPRSRGQGNSSRRHNAGR